ncbi:MAG: efflux RND transporter periplasmic adaptor subunit [Candidatus Kapabacteria bacterium]|jgi:membrane fusion protein (multidrug efflux system)|nr:efflux RND transporter periplasmic adaptor subunit [Candidatus Kapabacteria bacterium]
MQRFLKPFLITACILAAFGAIFLYRSKSAKSDKPESSASGANSGGANSGAAGKNAPIAVEGVIAKEVVIASETLSSGTLLANEETEIKSEITARITKINFTEGQNVQQGQLLVKLYDGDLQAQLQRVQAQYTVLQKTMEREKALLAVQGTSQQGLDVAEAQFAASSADIEVVKANIAKTEIRAPFNGKVGLRSVSVGAVVSPTQVMTTLQQTSSLKMDFSLPEKYSDDITVGSVVQFNTEGSPDTLKASIYALDAKIDPATRTIRIRARFNNSKGKLAPGAFAKVRVPLKQQRGIMIPTQAVIPQTRGKSVIVSREGKATMQPIETGLRTADKVEVISGLEDGDTIVTKGVMFVKPQMQLNFTKIQ